MVRGIIAVTDAKNGGHARLIRGCDYMEEITKLDEKYLVLKWGDVRNLLSIEERLELTGLIQSIKLGRYNAGKVESHDYLVLNLDDEIDLSHVWSKIGHMPDIYHKTYKIKDITVALVNAVLKAKG